MTVEEYAFQIIANVGMAKTMYLQALDEAKNNNFDKAQEMLDQGKEVFVEGHKAHAEILAKSAGADSIQMSMILAHAEDQLMSTETIEIMVKELIEVYKKIA